MLSSTQMVSSVWEDNSSLTDSFKHPVVIPKEHHVTKLIIAHKHEKTKHQGNGFTVNEIRASGFWIPGMSRAVTSFIHQCVICHKLRAAEGQRMSDLPVERVEPSPPFTYCGMDYFGPFTTTQGRHSINDTACSSPVFAHEPFTSRC